MNEPRKFEGLVLCFFSLLMSCNSLVYAQVAYQIQHQSPAVIERNTSFSLTFDVPGINQSDVQDAFLFYKSNGEISYRQVRATFEQGAYTANLKINDQNASSLDYYFSIQLKDGSQITYPVNAEQGESVQVEIVEQRQKTAPKIDEVSGIEYTILSPDPGSALIARDVLVAITLFYEEGTIDTTTSSFSLMLDGEDITGKAEATEYFFSYSPDDISQGEHNAVLLLNRGEETLEIASWEFTVVGPGEVAGSGGVFASGFEGQPTNSYIPSGQVRITGRNQDVGGIGNDILKGEVQLSGSKENIRYSAYGLITTEEESRLQPQNRYGAELYVGDWLELQGGHIYPTLSRLSISGRRVEGVNSELHLLNGGIHVQFLYGTINRDISNIYNAVTATESQSGGIVIDTTYTLSFSQNGIGTYRRNVVGGRLGFGKEEKFQWGVNLLKVRDDTNSINTIRNYGDLLDINPGLDDGLDQNQIRDLESNPDLLNISGNPQPKDNLVAGTDLRFNILQEKIQFRTESAISLLNEDISGGILTDDNSLGIDVDEDVKDQLDRLSWLIIINENMSALPFKYDVQGDDTDITAKFPTSVLANQSELNFSLPKNTFRLQYRWVGPDYVSLANSTVRRDVAGFTLTDRFNLLQNRLYVTLGYEKLNDNVLDNQDATTNTNTLRSNVSWFPIDQYLPRVSFGVMYRNRDNEIALLNPFIASDLENASVRNFEIANGDTVLAANPTLTNTIRLSTSISQQFSLLDINHDASLNLSVLNTKNDLFRYGDTDNLSINLNVRSRFTTLPFPLTTNLGLNINNTETLNGLTDISIVGFNMGGSTFLLEDKLNLSANLAFTTNVTESIPLAIDERGTSDTFDDIFVPSVNDFEETENNLFIFRTNAQYNLNANHAFVVNISFTNVSNKLSAGVNSPNDHMIQARYIYRF